MSATRPDSAHLPRTRRAVPTGQRRAARARLPLPVETDAPGHDAEPAAGAPR